jgi:hypothetical protein
MPGYKAIDSATRAEILSQIRDQGISVSAAGAAHNVSPKTIYTWLKQDVVDGNKNLILENNKLKRELDQAYRVIGRFTAESQRSKG